MLTPPPLKDDCFAMPAGAYWTPVDDALQMLKDRLSCVKGVETIDVEAAQGRILAHSVTAQRSNPPSANSAVDGYGFDGAIIGAGPQDMELVAGRAAAGMPFDGQVPVGKVIRILTGSILPKGVDTVVLEEDTATDGRKIAFNGPIKVGANTRKAGEDVIAGAVVLPAGRRITAADIALLSAVGVAQVDVRDTLKVAILSTGDELVPTGQSAGVGQIFDANRPMLAAILRQWGFEVIDMGAIADDPAAISDALDRGAQHADVILTSGGASAGDEDHISSLLNDTGSMSLWRIAVKPGRPLALGMWSQTPVFGLPGNPVAAFVCTLIFARPALSVLSGAAWDAPQSFMVPARFAKSKKEGRREYLRARITDGTAEAFGSEGSGRISGLSWATGLIELPDHAHDINVGDPVCYIPFSSFGL